MLITAGWYELIADDGFKVLVKRRGPVRRFLILSGGLSDEALAARLDGAKLFDARTDLVLHDFDDAGRDRRAIGKRVWTRAEKNQRLLNIATFVVDLAQDDEAIFPAMSSDYRRRVRKAAEQGVTVEARKNPSNDELNLFFTRFDKMASERGLKRLDRAAVGSMFAGGDLTLFAAQQDGETLNALIAYRAGDKAIFLYGVGGDRRNDGSGQFLHAEVMRSLKADGVRWYDLGGVATTDETDGIFRFKKGFGGELVCLGTEYVQRPPWSGHSRNSRSVCRGDFVLGGAGVSFPGYHPVVDSAMGFHTVCVIYAQRPRLPRPARSVSPLDRAHWTVCFVSRP